MTAGQAGDPGWPADGVRLAPGSRPHSGRPSAGVLADRLAAALVPREPGYQLPRRSALARRYQVSVADIDAALDELTRRRVVRLLPSGEAYRAGPAEYLVSPEGLPAASALLDPMGNHVSCRSRRVSWLRATAGTAGALGLAPGAQICVCRTLWSADGEPAASAATYVPERLSYLLTGQRPEQAGPGGVLAAPDWTARLGALRVEMQPPERSVARRLRLPTGLPAVSVTARYEDRDCGEPVALTEVALRPDRFRIVLDSSAATGGPEAAAQRGLGRVF